MRVGDNFAFVVLSRQATTDERVESESFRTSHFKRCVSRVTERNVGKCGNHIIRYDRLYQRIRDTNSLAVGGIIGDPPTKLEELRRS
jgi:hypothetical protein